MYFQDAQPVHLHVGRDALAPGVQREAWLYAPPSETCFDLALGAARHGMEAVELRSRDQFEACRTRVSQCALLVFAIEMEEDPVTFLSYARQLIGPKVPVLVLSRTTDVACLPGLIQPAHTDFVLLGAGAVEVSLRLQLLLDRVEPVQAPDQLGFGPYVVHLARKVITLDGEELPVSQIECELAILMFQNLGQVVLREKLIATVEAQMRRVRMRTTRSPDIQMSRVRKVLALEAHGYALKAVYGVGYRLDAVASMAADAQRSS